MPRHAPSIRNLPRRGLSGRALLLLVAAVLAAAGVAGGAETGARVAARVRAYEKANAGRAAVSVVALPPAGRDAAPQPLVAIRADRSSIPASNQKLLTAAFILAQFGGGYRFTTDVYLRGEDLVVVGGYDPLLGDPVLAADEDESIYAELDAWTAAVRAATGGRLDGDILLSGPAEATRVRPPGWPEDQLQREYAAPAWALNFHNNCIAVSFAANATRTEPRLRPLSRRIRVVNKVRVGKRNIWSMRTAEDGAVVVLRGTVTGKKTWPLNVAIDRPGLLLGRVLADRLARGGVAFDGRIRRVGPLDADSGGMRRLARTQTPLATVLQRVNKQSVNMAAECMLLAAGDGTWEGSAAMMERTLREAYGLGEDAVCVADGSGLARGNRVTARAMTTVLSALSRGRRGAVLLESLSTAGVDGTLDDRLDEPGCRGRIRAKTGYIRGVSCLSGYVLDRAGAPRMAFSVLVNGIRPGKAWKAKDLQDALCRILIRHTDAADEPAR
ncbi:MAG: D-alanyl-D-alanine carboxypeptidase/D-alanyl-D-alanine-endopeptidase [Planctomycetota bacterium]